MVLLRQEKVDRVALDIPDVEPYGDADADTLVIGWGGTFGHIHEAVDDLRAAGKKVAMAHFRYINPLPKNTGRCSPDTNTLSLPNSTSDSLPTFCRQNSRTF